MIWALLALVGVPVWLCALAILVLLHRNRTLRKRDGDVAVRMRRSPEGRWLPGHAIWTHDVLSFRSSPAGWSEYLVWVTGARVRDATDEERAKLHRLGDRPVIAELTLSGGITVEAAAAADDRARLRGPYARAKDLTVPSWPPASPGSATPRSSSSSTASGS